MSKIKASEQNKLRKIFDKCTEASASSLSKMLNEQTTISLGKFTKTEVSNLESLIPAISNQEVCAVYVKCDGDIRFGLLFIFATKQAIKLASQLIGKETAEGLNSLEKSAVAETGNILANSFLKGLFETTGLLVNTSLPGLAIDTFETLLDGPLAEIAFNTDNLIIANAEIQADKSNMKGNILILIDPIEIQKILTSKSTTAIRDA